jgi:hypothetical protein
MHCDGSDSAVTQLREWGKEHADQASLGQAYAFLGRSVLMLARRLVSVECYSHRCWEQRVGVAGSAERVGSLTSSVTCRSQATKLV